MKLQKYWIVEMTSETAWWGLGAVAETRDEVINIMVGGNIVEGMCLDTTSIIFKDVTSLIKT